MVIPASASPVKVGDVLASKYRVDRVLGMGGMGVVVAATHLELEQRVALKFLLADTSEDPKLVERFLREARASVRLTSPHVARTLDTGRLENGCPFIVMEFLDGRDLDAELAAAGGPLPVEDAASYVLHACDALSEAHSLGIVHRDLKPANLFLTRGRDGRGQVKVLDFGISKLVDGRDLGHQATALTKTDMVFGSPAYMSPEQMRSAKEVDARADIWSLGVVLYELLTGRLPFDGQTALELGLKVSQDEPARPSTFRPAVPEGLERVVLRCLEKDPRRRFASVGDLASALAPFAHSRERGLADRIAATATTAMVPAMKLPAEPSLPSTSQGVAVTTQFATSTTSKRAPLLVAPLAAMAFLVLAIAGIALMRYRGPKTDTPQSVTHPGSAVAPAPTTSAVPEPTLAAAPGPSPTTTPVVVQNASPNIQNASANIGLRAPSPNKTKRPVSPPAAPASSTAPAAPSAAPSGAPSTSRFNPVREG